MKGFKVCGLTRPDDARLAVQAGASAVGVIFAPSPRQVDMATAARVTEVVPDGVARVGVFADQPVSLVVEAVRSCGLDWVQLSGDEPPHVAEQIADLCGVWILKAVHVAGLDDLRRYSGYPAHAWLLDTPAVGRRGGTGRTFDWSLAEEGAGALDGPILVAGGLHADNVADAIRRLRPDAVDVCSGVESSPGVKDPARVQAFGEAVRAAMEEPSAGSRREKGRDRIA
ncbi:MAG TPA: phosphoribosylanthranilate isomerase [Longimicrobiales bacterium]|nr:phosphoribosylanthranilate isomerase [Longimicrobiales bacterium]